LQNAPWVTGKLSLDTSLQNVGKNTNHQAIQAEFLKIQHEEYQHLTPIFTDGSKMEDKTGCGIITPGQKIEIRLKDHTTVYSAELYAIMHALEYSANQQEEKMADVAIFTDSLSSIQAIERLYPANHPLLVRIKDILNDPRRRNRTALIWTPGHCGITGNELADSAAKNALNQ